MNKQRPSNFAMFTMVAFTASCIGLLIFLWISFGGSLPSFALAFVLSLGLGYVYERTGSLCSSITVHLLFNSLNTFFYVTQMMGH